MCELVSWYSIHKHLSCYSTFSVGNLDVKLALMLGLGKVLKSHSQSFQRIAQKQHSTTEGLPKTSRSALTPVSSKENSSGYLSSPFPLKKMQDNLKITSDSLDYLRVTITSTCIRALGRGIIRNSSGKGQDVAAVHRALLHEVIIAKGQEGDHNEGSGIPHYRQLI